MVIFNFVLSKEPPLIVSPNYMCITFLLVEKDSGLIWEGFRSSVNGSGSGSFKGVALL